MSAAMRPMMGRPGLRLCQMNKKLICSSFSQRWPSIPQAQSRKLLSTSTPTSSHLSSQRPDFSAPKQARALSPIILIGSLLIGGVWYYLATPPSRPDTLNDRFFVPYTITAREAISPSSFVITVKPDTPNPSHPYLLPKDPSSPSSAAEWRYPLWSVEFKQPEVQIARHYTPLPPLRGEDPADGSLRFYIRTVGDGEMSHYLARRQSGQDAHLRGPHAGFELLERLGDKSRVVFLAGGTGVAPGMQAAKAVLDANSSATVDLLWAVRKREEIQGAAPHATTSSWKFWAKKTPIELGQEIQDPSPVSRYLNDMKATYGDRLKIQVVVDEEGTKFQSKNLKDTLTATKNTSSTAVVPSREGCRFHDQTMHIGATEFAAPEAPGCICLPSEIGKPGKNLFIVSGPDGFIEHYAGQKIWVGGHQTQGPIGGVIRQLQRQEPHLSRDWLVLKM